MRRRWIRFGLRRLLVLVALVCILATCLRGWLHLRQEEARGQAQKELKRLENLVLFLETYAPQNPANRGKGVLINIEIAKTKTTIRQLKKQFPMLHTCNCGETLSGSTSVIHCPRCGCSVVVFNPTT